jgi:hypothetical protein
LVSCDYTCCSTGGNLNVHAIVSGVKNAYYCYGGIQQYVSVASATVSGPIIGPNGCSIVGAGLCSSNPVPVFPGGGGHSAITHSGNCYCGWWGAPGLVLVTFG